MWKLPKNGQWLDIYGWIVHAKPIYSFQKRIGYKIVIRTTIKVEGSENKMLPIYISYNDKHKNRRLYEYYVSCLRKPSPIHIYAKKRGERIYENTKLKDLEASDRIIWFFIYLHSKIEPVKEIPSNQLNINIYAK